MYPVMPEVTDFVGFATLTLSTPVEHSAITDFFGHLEVMLTSYEHNTDIFSSIDKPRLIGKQVQHDQWYLCSPDECPVFLLF